MPNWLYRTLLGGLFGVLVAVGLRVTQLSLAASDYFRSYYTNLGITANLDTQFGYVIEGVTLGVLPAGSDRDAITLAALDGAQTLRASAETYSQLFLWLALAFLVVGYLGSLWPNDRRRFSRCLIMIALLCMVIGQIAPIMSMTATSEVVLAGKSVVKQECKSIHTAVVALLHDGKTWVAVLIVLFSLVMPSVKLVLSLLAARVSPGRLRDGSLWLVRSIGKWSMADVFVVALLLTVFALRSAPGESLDTRSEVEIGLWFFASHCVLSMIATILITRVSKSRPLVELGPGGFGAFLVQASVCAAAALASLLSLRPSTRVADKFAVEVGHGWACSVLAEDTPGWLRGRWRSSGLEHGGADDTMVSVSVVGSDGATLKRFDHEASGTFDIPIADRGICSIVFDNDGIVRATARSVEVEMWFDPNNRWTLPF